MKIKVVSVDKALIRAHELFIKCDISIWETENVTLESLRMCAHRYPKLGLCPALCFCIVYGILSCYVSLFIEMTSVHDKWQGLRVKSCSSYFLFHPHCSLLHSWKPSEFQSPVCISSLLEK